MMLWRIKSDEIHCNKNNTDVTVYDAVVMTTAFAKIHPVDFMNPDSVSGGRRRDVVSCDK